VPFVPAGAVNRTLAPGVGFAFSWAQLPNEQQVRFLAGVVLDSGRDIAEFIEADNVRWDCLRAVSRG
ncbi:MAG TPA: hypothetical protein P5528_11270, partial [Steroidobacteraceae bacterium]|nr:hypothetical protein [Steroidobacteraceae bacterium]